MAETKKCSKCESVKPLGAFHVSRNETQGVASACKVCRLDEAKLLRGAKPQHFKRDQKRSTAAKRYGVPLDTYLEWIARPCEVCGHESDPANPNAVYVDRVTGVPLAILCRLCASAMGYLKHSADQASRALEILRRGDPLK